MRSEADRLIFFKSLAAKPYAYDFYQALRRVECLFPAFPEIGTAARPAQEAIRIGQEPSLDFAPAAVSGFHPETARRPPRLEVRFLGLLGPNGPLPLHLTDYARERMLHGGDETFARFLDVFNHRFLSLFYRAWAQAQPALSLDRPRKDRFSFYLASAFGIGSPAMRHRDSVPDAAKLFFAGLLARNVRNREGLEALLAGYFRMPVAVEEFVGHWMSLRGADRTRLGLHDTRASVGRGAVLGERVWDAQHKIRVRLGPLTLAEYESLLPGGMALARLRDWLRTYLSCELEWDAVLVLKRAEVPQTRLGRSGRLGWTTWLGQRAADADAADLTLDPERSMSRRGRMAAAAPGAELRAAA